MTAEPDSGRDGAATATVANRNRNATAMAVFTAVSRLTGFARIVVVELQVQRAFQVGKTMAAVPLQLWPGSPRDHDAVAPTKIRGGDAAETAGSSHGLFVEVAVLDELVRRQ